MPKLFKVCLDIEGNDRGLTVTMVAADNENEAVEKAKNHVGVTNNNQKTRVITVKGGKGGRRKRLPDKPRPIHPERVDVSLNCLTGR